MASIGFFMLAMLVMGMSDHINYPKNKARKDLALGAAFGVIALVLDHYLP